VRGVDFAAWTLAAFAIATFTGAIVKRTVPAMAAGLAVWAGVFFTAIDLLRPHYQAPLAGNAGSITVSWWIVGQSQGGAQVLYQPASRFWTFQLIEGGWLLALVVALLAAIALLVRDRAGLGLSLTAALQVFPNGQGRLLRSPVSVRGECA
jgi:hypothetical protein